MHVNIIYYIPHVPAVKIKCEVTPVLPDSSYKLKAMMVSYVDLYVLYDYKSTHEIIMASLIKNQQLHSNNITLNFNS